MDEIWERAVEAALDGQTDVASVRSLNLDGAVKCLHGRLPQPSLFEKFHSLQHFSIANIGVSSLEQFPRLRNLQRLILSDNRIAGGLEFLVEAGLESLRDLDLSNNRISDINDLRPLAELRLVSLDLYECPVTRIKDYRAQVFGLIRSLKYLDKMDVDENERPESEDEEEEDEEEEEDDPGSGEVDGEDHPFRLNNGDQARIEGVVDVDEDEESDADEEETETPRVVNGLSRGSRESNTHSNGFGVVAVDGEDDDDDEGEEDDDLVEVYEDDEGEGEDEDVVEVHEIDDSEDEDGVEYDEDEDEDEDEEEEVNNDERDFGEAGSSGRLTSMGGEIDGHEQGEDDVDEDDNGETGEEEQAVEEDVDFDDEAEDEEEDCDNGYLVQPVGRAEPQTGGRDMDPVDEDEYPGIEEDPEEDGDLDGEIQELPSSSSHKRKRNEDSHDDDDDCDDEEEEDDDDMVPYSKSSKHR